MEKSTHFSVIKEKIMKTNELLQMYEGNMGKLSKVNRAYKDVKTKYESSLIEINWLKSENEKINYDLNNLRPKYEQLEAEFKELQEKYNQHLIKSQLNYQQLELASPEKKSFKEEKHDIKLQELQDKCAKLKNSMTSCKKENAGLILRNKEIKNELIAERSKHNEVIKELNIENSKLMSDITQLQNKFKIFEAKISQSATLTEEKNMEINEFQKKINFLTLENERLVNLKKQNELSNDKLPKFENLIFSSNPKQDFGVQVNIEKNCSTTATNTTVEFVKETLKTDQEDFGSVCDDHLESDAESLSDIFRDMILPQALSPFNISPLNTEINCIENKNIPEVLDEFEKHSLMSDFCGDGLLTNSMPDLTPRVPAIIVTPPTPSTDKSTETEFPNFVPDRVVIEDIEPNKSEITQNLEARWLRRQKFKILFRRRELRRLRTQRRKILINRTKRNIKKRRIRESDTVLKALQTLKDNHINFTISNESIPLIPPYTYCNMYPPKVEVSTISNRILNTKTEKMTCWCQRCNKSNSYMLLNQRLNGSKELLGFFNVKDEIITPSTSRMANIESNPQFYKSSWVGELLDGIKQLIVEKNKKPSENIPEKRCNKRKKTAVAENSEFYSETEPELERLFKRSNVLKRNKMLLNTAKRQQLLNSGGETSHDSDTNNDSEPKSDFHVPKAGVETVISRVPVTILSEDTMSSVELPSEKSSDSNKLERTNEEICDSFKIPTCSEMLSPLPADISEGIPSRRMSLRKKTPSRSSCCNSDSCDHLSTNIKRSSTIASSREGCNIILGASHEYGESLTKRIGERPKKLKVCSASKVTEDSSSMRQTPSTSMMDIVVDSIENNVRGKNSEQNKIGSKQFVSDAEHKEALQKSDGEKTLETDNSNLSKHKDRIPILSTEIPNDVSILKEEANEGNFHITQEQVFGSLTSDEEEAVEVPPKPAPLRKNASNSTKKSVSKVKSKVMQQMKTMKSIFYRKEPTSSPVVGKGITKGIGLLTKSENNIANFNLGKECLINSICGAKYSNVVKKAGAEKKINVVQNILISKEGKSINLLTNSKMNCDIPLEPGSVSDRVRNTMTFDPKRRFIRDDTEIIPSSLNKKLKSTETVIKSKEVDLVSKILSDMIKTKVDNSLSRTSVNNSEHINLAGSLNIQKTTPKNMDVKSNDNLKNETSGNIDECPRSPSIIELPDAPPKIIPTEREDRLTASAVIEIIDKLIMYPNAEDVLNEIVAQLLHQDVDCIVQIILDRISLDLEKATSQSQHVPVMTETQKIFLGFMAKLEKEKPIFDRFLSKAELRLYNQKTRTLQIIQPITRLHVAVCKLRRDINRMRRFCCEAFYFMGDFAIPLFFTVLTMWSEVLPKQPESKEFPLAKVLVQLSHLKGCRSPGYNLYPLKDLLHKYFGYPAERDNCDTIFKEIFLDYLSNPASRLSNFTLLLFCKNKSTQWVHQKIKECFIPLVYKIPEENSNLRATIIILLGDICHEFDRNTDWAIIEEMKKWFRSLEEDSSSGVFKRSVYLAVTRLPSALPKAKLAVNEIAKEAQNEVKDHCKEDIGET